MLKQFCQHMFHINYVTFFCIYSFLGGHLDGGGKGGKKKEALIFKEILDVVANRFPASSPSQLSSKCGSEAREGR